MSDVIYFESPNFNELRYLTRLLAAAAAEKQIDDCAAFAARIADAIESIGEYNEAVEDAMRDERIADEVRRQLETLYGGKKKYGDRNGPGKRSGR